MSDRGAPPRPTLSPFGFTLAGTVLLLGAAGYNYLASNPFYPELYSLYFEWLDVNAMLLPFAISGLGCALWWFGHARSGIVVIALIAVPGTAAMLLEHSWGETLMHGTPQSAKRFARTTYASDLLFFLGFGFNTLACALALWSTRSNRRASSRTGGIDD